MPTISIVTPSYNQARYLERTIRSVVDQGYPGLEYIVQDGGSTDGSVTVLRRYSRQITYWESRPDQGQSSAINRGFARTTGEIMAFLNSDDVLFPGSLACVGRYFGLRPDVDVVYSHGMMIDEDDRPVLVRPLPSHSDRALRLYDYILQPTLFWRRSAWEASGAYIDESFHYALDWELMHRFLDAGLRFERIPALLAGFRLQSEQKTQTIRRSTGTTEVALIRRRFMGRPVSTAEVVLRAAPCLFRQAAFTIACRVGLRKLEYPSQRSAAGAVPGGGSH